MTQNQLNKLYASFEDKTKEDDNYDKHMNDYMKELKKLGANVLSFDWKEAPGDVFAELTPILKKLGITVLEDPMLEGTDTYGYILVKND